MAGAGHTLPEAQLKELRAVRAGLLMQWAARRCTGSAWPVQVCCCCCRRRRRQRLLKPPPAAPSVCALQAFDMADKDGAPVQPAAA